MGLELQPILWLRQLSSLLASLLPLGLSCSRTSRTQWLMLTPGPVFPVLVAAKELLEELVMGQLTGVTGKMLLGMRKCSLSLRKSTLSVLGTGLPLLSSSMGLRPLPVLQLRG